jgi:DNA-binding transcriptional ArsR family regulator
MPHASGIRVIDDPETLRLIADPLRLRLLELLRRQPRTVTELATELDLPRTNLYYHVRLLESHELVEIDETRVVSGITEKRYRAVAYRLSVEKALIGTEGRTPLEVYLSFVLDEVAGEILRAVDAGLIELEGTDADTIAPRRLALGRSWFWFTDRDVEAFNEAIDEAYSRFDDQRAFIKNGEHSGDTASRPAQLDPHAQLYENLTAFYPVVHPENDSDD